MTRPRVLHVVVAGEIGGAERLLVDLASRPAETRAEHAVALFTPNETLAALLRAAGLEVHDRGRVGEGPLTYVWRSFGPRDTAWLAAIIAGTRATVVHVHTFGSQVLGVRAALRAGVPVVRTDHSTRAYVDPSCWPFSRWALARSAAVVPVSEHLRRVALAKAPFVASKARVVLSGVDVERFSPRPRPSAEPPRFAVVARLDPRKGVDLALRALALVPGASIDIAGAGSERPKLERLASQLGLGSRVRFHGFVGDPRPVFAASHAVLCSSREEGLGLAYLEAMAMERPVVGLPTGGVPEIVRDGETGLLARQTSPAALAARMRDLLSMPEGAAHLGRSARAWVIRHASVASMCRGYAEVYEDVLAHDPCLARARPRR